MNTTIEKEEQLAHVRLSVPKANHDRAHSIKRLLQVKKNEDVTVISIYHKAIEIGLTQLEKAAA